jgi:hypothetical protein
LWANLVEGNQVTQELAEHNKPVFDQLHPTIYKAAIGLIAWFAVSAWVFFDRRGDIGLSLAFVTLLLLVAILLPVMLSLAWRRDRRRHDQGLQQPRFRDWLKGDFAVWGSKLRSAHAAIDMLLPLAAVAFGLTAIGIVFLADRAMVHGGLLRVISGW